VFLVFTLIIQWLLHRQARTNNKVEKNLEDLKLWLLIQEDNEDAPIINNFYKIEDLLFLRGRIKNLKQTTIDSFAI